jgi:arylsulfatase A-like enzyme
VHNCAIRKGNWKLVRLNEKVGSDDRAPAWRLYDLASDIGEQEDMAAGHKDVVNEFNALFEAWRSMMHPTL